MNVFTFSLLARNAAKRLYGAMQTSLRGTENVFTTIPLLYLMKALLVLKRKDV